MAMSEDQIREAMRQSFSSYATKMRRASLVLGSNLSVLKGEAELAKLAPDTFGRIALEEVDRSERRMKVDAATFHPVIPFLREVS
ncbi:hypothetical protein [Pseudophaeobacter sp.]|uniref:hypothetical protein n=1 Tax=Pseudophaeobacter sp. TaxID=1971739 RepID=UPI0032994028